jgi:hypothetical protein
MRFTLPIAIGLCSSLLAMRATGQEPDKPDEETAGASVLRGKVLNADQGRAPIEGAVIQLSGTSQRAVSKADGGYEIGDVAPGLQTLLVTKSGYQERSVTALVPAGATIDLPVYMFAADESADTVFVLQRLRTTSNAGVQAKRQEAATKDTVMGKEQIRAGPASNTADVVKQLPAVSVVDGRFVFVRGLGDRYSQTLLNGSNLPSPEPDKRAVPVDLFPANLLDSLAISKTYSPDFPGEFAGGSLLIRTVDVPDKPFFTLGADLKYRNGTTLRDFKTYHGGNLDMFAVDDGTRALPDEVPQDKVVGGTGAGGLTDDEIQTIARSFTDIWSGQTVTAPFDHKVAISFGERWGAPGDGSLGIVGALNWANKYLTIRDEKRRIIVNEGTPENPKPVVFSDFTLDSWTFESELSGLLNLTYEVNEAQKVGVRSLYTRAASDEVREQGGTDGQNPYPIQLTRLRYVQRSLLTVQPFGEHLLVGDTLLEWRLGYALSQRDEPDNRQVRYIQDPVTKTFVFEPSAASGRRDFYQLDENIYDGAFDYSIPFSPFGVKDKAPDPDRKVPLQRIKLGPAVTYRDRDFNTRRFLFSPVGGSRPVDENGRPIDFFGSPEDIFQNKNLNPDGIVIEEKTRPTDNYQATQSIIAGYGLADFRVAEDWRLQGGARAESSKQEVTTFALFSSGTGNDEVKTKLETLDVLPSANLIWEFYKDMQLRLGGSQTVSRPEFRELAPFEYTDVEGGFAARGNPNLQRAKIINADLSWDWFLSPTELISAGLFYKSFKDPIEVVNLPLGGKLLTTWENADSAELLGFEVEARKRLGFLLGDWDGTKTAKEAEKTGIVLNDFSLLANFSWMHSEVDAAQNAGEFGNTQTNPKRPLQGQPDYLLNLGLLFDSKFLDATISVLANTTGKLITAVGTSGVDDEKLQPRWSLDVSITKRFGNGTLKLTAENLLDDKYVFKQGDITTREFRRGFAVGFGYSYSF